MSALLFVWNAWRVFLRLWYLFALLFLFFFLPTLYVINDSLPPASQWREASGTVTVVVPKGQRPAPVVKVDGQEISCASRVGRISACAAWQDMFRWRGSTAHVYWFPQRLFPFTTLPRVIALTVDGVTVVSVEKTRADMEAATHIFPNAEEWLWMAIVLAAFLVSALLSSMAERRDVRNRYYLERSRQRTDGVSPKEPK